MIRRSSVEATPKRLAECRAPNEGSDQIGAQLTRARRSAGGAKL